MAVDNNRYKVKPLLLEKGADFNIKNNSGLTPISALNHVPASQNRLMSLCMMQMQSTIQSMNQAIQELQQTVQQLQDLTKQKTLISKDDDSSSDKREYSPKFNF